MKEGRRTNRAIVLLVTSQYDVVGQLNVPSSAHPQFGGGGRTRGEGVDLFGVSRVLSRDVGSLPPDPFEVARAVLVLVGLSLPVRTASEEFDPVATWRRNRRGAALGDIEEGRNDRVSEEHGDGLKRIDQGTRLMRLLRIDNWKEASAFPLWNWASATTSRVLRIQKAILRRQAAVIALDDDNLKYAL